MRKRPTAEEPMYGTGNSGPAKEVWNEGDRICWHHDKAVRGIVAKPPRDPNAAETNMIFVRWDDGQSSFQEPNTLDRA
jgi:hypothetical protein